MRRKQKSPRRFNSAFLLMNLRRSPGSTASVMTPAQGANLSLSGYMDVGIAGAAASAHAILSSREGEDVQEATAKTPLVAPSKQPKALGPLPGEESFCPAFAVVGSALQPQEALGSLLEPS